MKKKIIILGAGGHAKSCIDIIEAENKYKIIGLLDQNKKKGFKVSKYSVLGSDSYLKEVRIITNVAFLAVGHIKDSEAREKLYFKAS